MKFKKILNEFEVQTSWDIFKLFLKIYWTTLSSMVKYHTQSVFEKEIPTQKQYTNTKMFKLKSKQVLYASTK